MMTPPTPAIPGGRRCRDIHSRSIASFTLSSRAMWWYQVICASRSCTIVLSRYTSANFLIYFRFRTENPFISGNSGLRSWERRSITFAPPKGSPIFTTIPRKKRPSYSRSVRSSQPGWRKPNAQKNPCRTTIKGHCMRCISADFWQSGQFPCEFPPRNESGPDLLSTTGAGNHWKGNGALIGRISAGGR